MKNYYLPLFAILQLSLYSCNNSGDFGEKAASIDQRSIKVQDGGNVKDNNSTGGSSNGGGSTGGSSNGGGSTGGSSNGGGSTGGSSGYSTGGGDAGVMGGHFDLDTAHISYPLNQGSTDAHVHEYDDIYGNEVDYFNMSEPALGEIQDVIKDWNQPFFILISNAELSTSPVLQINGVDHNIVTYQNNLRTILAANGTPQKYILGNNPPAGVQKLTSLKLIVPVNALSIKDGLIATGKSCAILNGPGSKGEYRCGSLTIQAIRSTGYHIDPIMNVASTATDALLWESFIFWHKDVNQ